MSMKNCDNSSRRNKTRQNQSEKDKANERMALKEEEMTKVITRESDCD